MRQLAANARRDKIRSDKVAAWRIDPSLSGIIKYFYWRSRFPIIQKLLNRSFLFLELSLIFFFFHTTIVSSMALLLLGVFAFNAIAIGLRQYFRVEIVKAQQDHHQGLASQLLTSCTIISIFLGLTAGLTLTCVTYLSNLPTMTLFYAAAWAIILPLEYLQSTAWMAVYTEHRLRRRISIIFVLRLYFLSLHTPG